MSATTTNSVLTEVSSSTRRPQRPPPLPRHFTTSVVTMCWVDSFTSTTRWPRSQAVSGDDRSHIAGDIRLIDRSSKSLRGVASTSRSGEESSVLKQDAPTRLMSAHQYDGEGLNQVARRDRAKRSTFSALQPQNAQLLRRGTASQSAGPGTHEKPPMLAPVQPRPDGTSGAGTGSLDAYLGTPRCRRSATAVRLARSRRSTMPTGTASASTRTSGTVSRSPVIPKKSLPL